MPPIVFALFLLQVPPFRNSDLGPHSGHSSPLPRYGVCLQVLCQEEFSSSFPSVTRVELCIHTLSAFKKAHSVGLELAKSASLVVTRLNHQTTGGAID